MSGIVDVHAHVLIPDALLLTDPDPGAVDPRLPGGRLLRPLVDLDTRLAVMDAAGVDVQAVSVVPGHYHRPADRMLAARLVDVLNAGLAALVRRAPDRLVGICTIALHHPDLAADQLRRAVDDYDFRGVQVSPAGDGPDLSQSAFDPFWSIAESLEIPVFVRPRGCGRGGPPPVGGVLDRHPALVICTAHRGGERSTRQYVESPVASPAALCHLMDTAGPDRILLGSDYPFGDHPFSDHPYEAGACRLPALLDTLPQREREAVAGGTARALLRLDGAS